MAAAHDASSSGVWTSGLTITVSHTCASGAVLLVWVGYHFTVFTSISGVTYNSSALSFVGQVDNGTNQRLALYKHESPAAGTHDIVVTVNDTTSLALGVVAASATGGSSVSTHTTAGPLSDQSPTVTIPNVGADDLPYAACLSVANPTEQDVFVVEVSPGEILNLSRQAAGGNGVINWTQGTPDTWICNGARVIGAAAAGDLSAVAGEPRIVRTTF